MKVCSQCKNEKPLSDFPRDFRNKDGYQGRCRECYNLNRKERYHSDSDYRERVNRRHRKYNDKALSRAKKGIEEISDTYVIAELKRGTSLTTSDIRKHPQLIQLKRQTIKNKRLCRSKM